MRLFGLFFTASTVYAQSTVTNQLRLRHILPPFMEEIVDELRDSAELASDYSLLGALGAWKASFNNMVEAMRIARVNFLEDVDDAMTTHTNTVEEIGLPSPLIQGVAEWNSYWPMPMLLPDVPLLGPFNPFLWASGV